MRYVNCVTAFFKARRTLLTKAQPCSQIVVLQYYVCWKTSRGNDSKPVQEGQDITDTDPSGNVIYYVICSAELSLKDTHQVFNNKFLCIFSKMRQNVPNQARNSISIQLL